LYLRTSQTLYISKSSRTSACFTKAVQRNGNDDLLRAMHQHPCNQSLPPSYTTSSNQESSLPRATVFPSHSSSTSTRCSVSSSGSGFPYQCSSRYCSGVKYTSAPCVSHKGYLADGGTGGPPSRHPSRATGQLAPAFPEFRHPQQQTQDEHGPCGNACAFDFEQRSCTRQAEAFSISIFA
jgi:hypothetical protein